MKILDRKIALTLLLALVAPILAACGGGGASTDPRDSSCDRRTY